MSGQCGRLCRWRRSCDLPKLWNLLALATLPLALTCCCAAVSLPQEGHRLAPRSYVLVRVVARRPRVVNNLPLNSFLY